jgi:hypothetical protein
MRRPRKSASLALTPAGTTVGVAEPGPAGVGCASPDLRRQRPRQGRWHINSLRPYPLIFGRFVIHRHKCTFGSGRAWVFGTLGFTTILVRLSAEEERELE